MKSTEYKRGYNDGYKQGLLDALSMQTPERRARYSRRDYPKRFGGPLYEPPFGAVD